MHARAGLKVTKCLALGRGSDGPDPMGSPERRKPPPPISKEKVCPKASQVLVPSTLPHSNRSDPHPPPPVCVCGLPCFSNWWAMWRHTFFGHLRLYLGLGGGGPKRGAGQGGGVRILPRHAPPCGRYIFSPRVLSLAEGATQLDRVTALASLNTVCP